MTETGRVYKIVCSLSDDVYIGSTFNELKHRFQQHKQDYRKWKVQNNKKKLSIYDAYDKYDIKNFRIILIKEYQVCDKMHLEVYEQLWINKSKCVNINNPFYIKHITKKHHYIANKDEIINRQKKYYYDNQKKSKDAQRIYRNQLVSCKCGKVMTKGALRQHLIRRNNDCQD